MPDSLTPESTNSRAYSPAPGTLLTVPGTPSGLQQHKLKNTAGYENVVFAGKKAQADRVKELVRSKAFIPENLVSNVRSHCLPTPPFCIFSPKKPAFAYLTFHSFSYTTADYFFLFCVGLHVLDCMALHILCRKLHGFSTILE